MTTNPAAPIVVGVDGSPHSLRALDWAAREAAARQRPLRIVHAFLWPLMQRPAGTAGGRARPTPDCSTPPNGSCPPPPTGPAGPHPPWTSAPTCRRTRPPRR